MPKGLPDMPDSHKRKRDKESSKKSKKARVIVEEPSEPTHTIRVTSVLKHLTAPPVIATTPGIVIPSSVKFQAHTKSDKSKKRKNGDIAPTDELVLHSEDHERMDYTAHEDRPAILNNALSHYVGAFDPKTGELQIIEARKMIVRGTVRARKAADDAMAIPVERKTNMALRADLGETFGTKKAIRALKSVTENAISTTKKNGKLDEADVALMDSVKDAAATIPTREDLQATLDVSRSIPKGNFEAAVIQEVYEPEEIIGAEILRAIPIMDWQEGAKKKEAVFAKSRFVANRIVRLAANDDAVSKLRLLRYLEFVLIFYLGTTKGKHRGTLRIEKRDKLREAMAPAPEPVIENIRRKFSDNGEMRKQHVDLLMTHCCVFSCLLDNFESNTFDLREDLKLEQKELNQYYKEIGARIKVHKKDGNSEHLAKLALPLQFPKLKRGRR